MPKCSFKFCKTNSTFNRKITDKTEKKEDLVTYFHFPGHIYRREQWIDILRRQRGDPYFEPNNTSVVCERHFNENDFYVSSMGTKRICNTAVPIIEPGHVDISYALHVAGGSTQATSCEDHMQPGTSKPSYHSSDTNDTGENNQRIGKKIKMSSPRLDMTCELEDNTQLTSFDIPYLSSTRYPGDESPSDLSDTSENCHEIDKKVNMGKGYQNITFVYGKKGENRRPIINYESQLQLDTSKPVNNYSSATSDSDVANEIENKIKIEVEEPTLNTVEHKDNRLDDQMSTPGNRFQEFGEYVVTMLNSMPLQQALDLQPRIVDLITSTINYSNEGNTIPKIKIKTEDEMFKETD